MGDNSVIYREGLCTLHFLSLPSIYIPSFIQMPTVVIKLFAGQGTGQADAQTKQRLYASPSDKQ